MKTTEVKVCKTVGVAIGSVLLGITVLAITLVTALGLTLNVGIHRELENIKGVNLGSWLVLENWMTPEVFEGTTAYDEYTLATQLPPEEYARRIQLHRSTFVTQDDFQKMAEIGLNTVRIPIPYYIFGDREDLPFIACINELDNAFDWAEMYGMRIMIDIHMVYGSQNGFDNGGFSGVCAWPQYPDEIEYTLDLLERLAIRYGHREGLLGIQPLNEPMISDTPWMEMGIPYTYIPVDDEMLADSIAPSLDFVKEFYLEAYERIHPHLGEDKWVIFHDGFQMWNFIGFMKNYENVAFDTHVYLFNVENQAGLKSPGWHTAFAWGNSALMRLMAKYAPMIVGEWNVHSNYALGEFNTLEERGEYYKQCGEMQLSLWERCGAGYTYWNWKLGSGAQSVSNYAWELEKCVEYGWINI